MSLPFNITNPGFQLGGALTTAEQEFVTNLVGLTYAQGDVLYYDGTDLFNLGAGTSGYFLKTQGAGANPRWITASGTGDVTAAAALGDHLLIRGDGASKGVQNSGITVSDTDALSGIVGITADTRGLCSKLSIMSLPPFHQVINTWTG